MADRPFAEGIQHLIDEVGRGDLIGHIEVDQWYAHYQNANEFAHPGGGQSHYLDEPFFARNRQHMEHLARNAITTEGSNLTDAMMDNMEDMSQQVYEKAPFEFGDLKASGHPFVEDDGVVVRDRKPNMRRLTEDELRAKGDLRRLGFGN